MKLNLRYIFLSLLLVAGCTDEENDNKGIGESINDFTLKSPENFSVLELNPATPDKGITVEWNAAVTGLEGIPTYTFLLDVKGGDFSAPLLEVEANDEGIATAATILQSEIASAIANATGNEFEWTVRATTVHPKGINEKLASTPFQWEINESQYGISDFDYLSPDQNEKIFLDKVRTPNDEVIISWEAATATSGTVTYAFEASTTANGFDSPVLELPSDNSGTSTTLTLTHAEFVEALSNIDYEDGLYWRIVASTTVGDNVVYSYSPETRFMWFEIFDVPTLYIVGSLTDNWNNTCGKTIALTNKGNGVFEKLVNIPAGAQFKFVLECGSWAVNWGGPGGNADPSTDYAIVSNSSNNIAVVNAGFYIVRADFGAGTFKLTPFSVPSNLYLVGGASSAGWSPGNSIPFVDLGNYKFEIYAYLTADGFKFLQVQDWAGDWGAKPGTSSTDANGVITGEVIQDGEDNVNSPASGFYRVTVDFNSVSYKLEPMQWGIIGSATANGWPGPDSDMTFVAGSGSYKWTITTDLVVGEMKFRANDSWDVNFGDNGANGSLEYSAGSNIVIGSAGNYTIEMILDPVNGYSYTITLNP